MIPLNVGLLTSLAIVADYREEGWASMDLVAEQLYAQLTARQELGWRPSLIRPTMPTRLGRLGLPGRLGQLAFNADRLLARQVDYPTYLRDERDRGRFAAYHVADHSYGHLALSLPPGRTGVFCHDLDFFRCLVQPTVPPVRGPAFAQMARRALTGLQRSGVVFVLSETVRQELLGFGLLEPSRTVVAHPGVSAEFTPEPTPGEAEVTLAAERFLLHVGSCIPRKRIDVLLSVFAELARSEPGLRLVQIGGSFSAEQREQIARLGIGSAVRQFAGVSRAVIAAHYRSAALVLQPSQSEGFGLPVAEALACGTAVLASDLPVLREIGGAGASFAPVGDIAAWVEQAGRLLRDPTVAPPRSARLAQAAKFTWARHAEIVAATYRGLLA